MFPSSRESSVNINPGSSLPFYSFGSGEDKDLPEGQIDIDILGKIISALFLFLEKPANRASTLCCEFSGQSCFKPDSPT